MKDNDSGAFILTNSGAWRLKVGFVKCVCRQASTRRYPVRKFPSMMPLYNIFFHGQSTASRQILPLADWRNVLPNLLFS
jgi:hypothetical protein